MGLASLIVPVMFVFLGTMFAWLAARRIAAVRLQGFPAWRGRIERVVLSLAALAAMCVAASSVVDAIVSRADYLPGALYLVNGHRMRMECTGSGTPTLVLDAGLGNDGLIWSGIQPLLAKTTRVWSYDRAGFGWSDPLPPPRDAEHIAVELHGLLAAAGINGPVVLMGHSIAGLYIREYANRYPSAIAGLIFVDSSTPLPQRDPAIPVAERTPQRIRMLLERTAFAIRLPRLFGACPGSFPGYKLRTLDLQLEGLCREHLEAFTGEQENFDRSAEEASQGGSYGGLPILIFSRDPASFGCSSEALDRQRAWNRKQAGLKKLSTQSRRVIAKGSGHYVQLDRPELVEREVRLFIEQVRGTAPETARNRTTALE